MELDDGVDDVVAAHFGGDATLYRSFLDSCAAQFASDAAAGDAACQVADLQALRVLAHNLKSALYMLGRGRPGDLAARVERLAAHGDWPAARTTWRALRGALVRPHGS